MAEAQRDGREFELLDYLSVLRRRKLTVILTVAATVLIALAYSLLQTPIYQATAEVLLQNRASEDILSAESDATNRRDQQELVNTEIEVMRSRSVRQAVSEELGYTPSVAIAAKGGTSVVTLSSRDTDKARAAREANTYAGTYIEVRRQATIDDLLQASTDLQEQISALDEQIDELDAAVDAYEPRIASAPDDATREQLTRERDRASADADSERMALQNQRVAYNQQLGTLQLSANTVSTGGAQLVSEAEAPSSPVSPDPVRNASVAVLLGLLLGAGLAFLRDYLDDTVRTKDDLDALTGGLDVLGLVPRVETWKNRAQPQLVSVSAPNSPPAEAYRALRTALQFIGVDRDIRLIQLTSAAAAEGKTTTIANLGVALARAGRRVIVVDCDLRRPRLHQFFGLDNAVGLTTVILGEDELEDAIQVVPDVPRLAVLASGPPPPNPSELLSTQTAASLLTSLLEYDYVLIDCPPLLPVSDAVIVARYVDATVLVTTVDSTTKRSIGRSMELLRQVDAPLVGAVLNGLDSEGAYAYGYRYGGYAEVYAKSSAAGGRFSRKGRSRRHVGPEDAADAPMPQPVPDRGESSPGQ